MPLNGHFSFSLSCLRCNKFFWNLAKLREHNATHALKPYRDKLAVLCHECGGLFTESKLRAHALTHLPIEQKPIFECYICKRTYACRISLRNHWPDHVGGRKRFKCSTCDKDFARRDSLRRHQGIHKGELPFFCIECGKKFRSKKSLQVSLSQFFKYKRTVDLNGKSLNFIGFIFRITKTFIRIQSHSDVQSQIASIDAVILLMFLSISGRSMVESDEIGDFNLRICGQFVILNLISISISFRSPIGAWS